jgi:hypothetical protein
VADKRITGQSKIPASAIHKFNEVTHLVCQPVRVCLCVRVKAQLQGIVPVTHITLTCTDEGPQQKQMMRRAGRVDTQALLRRLQHTAAHVGYSLLQVIRQCMPVIAHRRTWSVTTNIRGRCHDAIMK